MVTPDSLVGTAISVGQWRLELSGGRVSVADTSSLEPDLLRVLLEGPVRGLELLLKGAVVLHASAVALGGHAIAILGRAGAGKSSLSAMLTKAGAWLVSDGMTSIAPDTATIDPGLARFKLSDEALRKLGEDPKRFERVSSEDPKRYYPYLRERPAKLPKLVAIYHLVPGSEEALTKLEPTEKLVFLTAHGYLSNFLPPSYRPVIWERTQRLMQTMPNVFELRRRQGWEQMDSVVRMLLDHMSQLTAGESA